MAEEQCPYAGQAGASAAASPEEPSSERNAKKRRVALAARKSDPLYYHAYLQLDKVLDAQHPLSGDQDTPAAHDEHLFIVTHQTYELWFKQILHELDSVHRIFSQPGGVPESAVGCAVSRLVRIVEVQRVLLDQLNVLETMTPLNFLDFRDYLFPASGFQSVQFRLVENKLGLQQTARIQYGQRGYCTYLNEQHSAAVAATEGQPSLFDLLEGWLERTPFLALGDFNFWTHYEQSVRGMLARDREFIEASNAPDEVKAEQLADMDKQVEHYDALLQQEKYDALRARGGVRLSYRAMQAALLIMLYQDEPILQLAYRVLSTLQDIDENFTRWRYRHSLMVHRMLGVKIGTGGSSGYHYLRATAAQHRVFKDLFNLSTFLIPRSELPPLPDNVRRLLGFSHEDSL